MHQAKFTYRAEGIHAQEGSSGYYQAPLLQVKEMAFQTVFYTSGRVQLAVDRIHGSESAASHGLIEHGCALNRKF